MIGWKKFGGIGSGGRVVDFVVSTLARICAFEIRVVVESVLDNEQRRTVLVAFCGSVGVNGTLPPPPPAPRELVLVPD